MRYAIIAIAAGICLALPAPAEELRLGLSASLEYDDNLFNAREDSESEKEQDVVFRTSPLLELSRSQGDLTYSLRYALRWESYIVESGFDNFDHTFLGRASWRLGPRTQLTLTDSFFITQSISRRQQLEEADVDVEPDVRVETDRQRLKSNSALLELTHRFTPRIESATTASYRLFRSNEENTFDSDFYAVSNRFLYDLDRRNRVGGGIAATLQSFENSATGEGSDTLFYNAFLSWIHVFDPTMTLRLQVGPTFVDSDPAGDERSEFDVVRFPFRSTPSGGARLIDPATCPITDDGQPFLAETCDTFPTELSPLEAFQLQNLRTVIPLVDDSDSTGQRTTFFADINITKQWERWVFAFSYRRTDSGTSGQGQSSVLDLASLQASWTPSSRWTVRMTGSFANRESATDQVTSAIGLMPAQIFVARPGGTIVLPAAESVDVRLVESDQAFSVQSWRASLLVQRRLGRRSSVSLRFTYLQQEQDDDFVQSKLENLLIGLSFAWRFDPIIL